MQPSGCGVGQRERARSAAAALHRIRPYLAPCTAAEIRLGVPPKEEELGGRQDGVSDEPRRR